MSFPEWCDRYRRLFDLVAGNNWIDVEAQYLDIVKPMYMTEAQYRKRFTPAEQDAIRRLGEELYGRLINRGT